MCEIIAVLANENVEIGLSWSAHQIGATRNPHGWGAAWLDGSNFNVRKAPKPLPQGVEGLDLVNDIRTTRFIGHTRYKVQGNVSPNNTQPFTNHGNKYAFAATMSGCKAKRFRAEVRERLEGETGPEILFQFILVNYEKRGLEGLRFAVDEFFSPKSLPKTASASFVFCTPEDTYVFRFSKPLFYCKRVPPYDDNPVHLRGQTHKQYQLSLQKSKTANQRTTIIATERLTSEQWHSVDDNKLFSVTFDGLQPV